MPSRSLRHRFPAAPSGAVRGHAGAVPRRLAGPKRWWRMKVAPFGGREEPTNSIRSRPAARGPSSFGNSGEANRLALWPGHLDDGGWEEEPPPPSGRATPPPPPPRAVVARRCPACCRRCAPHQRQPGPRLLLPVVPYQTPPYACTSVKDQRALRAVLRIAVPLSKLVPRDMALIPSHAPQPDTAPPPPPPIGMATQGRTGGTSTGTTRCCRTGTPPSLRASRAVRGSTPPRSSIARTTLSEARTAQATRLPYGLTWRSWRGPGWACWCSRGGGPRTARGQPTPRASRPTTCSQL
mmetsp:Transcript_24145/g.75767  ORF Transcript_24145/g.75767 Transcript_24145/m.75767 type:complete len:295 (+) Transcript_24145:917-1801(+)